MKASLEWMNVTYDLEFAAPSFELPGRNTDVLRALYETIHPRYPIGTRDMHVSGGNLLSDVHVRVTLFNGNGVIDVSVDRMSLVFSNLKTREDLTVCKDCIALSEEALQSSLPDVSIRAVALKSTLFLELVGGQENAGNYLSRLLGSSIQPDLSAFGNAVQHPGVNLEIENAEEGWNAVFHAFRDRTRATFLVLAYQIVYGAEGKIRDLDNRVNHLEQLLKVFLDSIGLEMPDSTE